MIQNGLLYARRIRLTRRIFSKFIFSLLIFAGGHNVRATTSIVSTNGVSPPASTNLTSTGALAHMWDVLPPGKWPEVEKAVDRGLAWLASQQTSDGSFPSAPSGQPAATSLAVMAFLSRGHQPGSGKYGAQLNRAIDFVLSCQKTNGLLCYETPAHKHALFTASHTASYNHAISGLMLCEAYGQVTGPRAKQLHLAVQKALHFTRDLQVIRQKRTEERGGWRYLELSLAPFDSDLSATGWHIMFLRSAKNAEFEIPPAWINEALYFVSNCWDRQTGAFSYGVLPGGKTGRENRGLTGAGILSLSLGGLHETSIETAAGNWLLAHPYREFGETEGEQDMFFYSAYYCSQAVAQLGGRYWKEYYPEIVKVMLSGQAADGSWPSEFAFGGGIQMFGNAYTSALAVLSLTVPYQLLPVYQR